MSNKIYNRKTKEYIIMPEPSATLTFLYDTVVGRIFLKIMTTKAVSKLVGCYMNTRLSKYKINRFIKANNIDMSDYLDTTYKNFNEFFSRKIDPQKRPIQMDSNTLIAVADSKLLRYKITPKLVLNIKNANYTVEELLKDKEISKEYMGGECLVFRLCVDDYHRYIYIDDGEVLQSKKITGVLHTVSPISDGKYKVYSQNSREWTLIKTKNFDNIIQMEVGAMCVGKIKNFHDKEVTRGQEKGYFEFGGSTIIVFIKKDMVKIDGDILDNSFVGIETIVKQGERIGEKM